MVKELSALVVYLGIVYVPFVICVGIVWLVGASIFRKTKGDAWQAAIKRSGKEAAITTIILLIGLFSLGLFAFLGGV
jgi:hypothetical protein